MRLRNKNWTTKFLKENEKFLVNEEQDFIIADVFGNDGNVTLEIGCGKGNFITELAVKNPQHNFLAMEKERTVVGVALRNTLRKATEIEQPIENLRFINARIERFEKHIPDNSIERIYLNFSDPWPKSRHAKYRLTGRKFLAIYNRILVENGEIHIKTDNDSLYKFTIDEAIFSNFRTVINEQDIYSKPEIMLDNIPTEYEKKFQEMGFKIKKVILRKKPSDKQHHEKL